MARFQENRKSSAGKKVLTFLVVSVVLPAVVWVAIKVANFAKKDDAGASNQGNHLVVGEEEDPSKKDPTNFDNGGNQNNGQNNNGQNNNGQNNEQGDTGEENKEKDYTEAEYKAMAIEKLEEVATEAHNNDRVNSLTGITLNNFKITKINKETGYIYGYGDVAKFTNDAFITVSLKDETLLKDCKSNKDVAQKAENLTYEDFNKPKYEENLQKETTPDIYNDFLDSVVKDEGFRTALENEGVTFSEDVTAWEELATVVNTKRDGRKVIEINFVDFVENKTVTVRVWADISLQESGTVANQVFNTTRKDKIYTIVDVQDFSTIKDSTAQQAAIEFGK